MGNWQRLRAERAVYHISDVARDVIAAPFIRSQSRRCPVPSIGTLKTPRVDNRADVTGPAYLFPSRSLLRACFAARSRRHARSQRGEETDRQKRPL